MEFILFPISFALVLICAVAIRILGIGPTYKLFFAVFAIIIVLATVRG